MPSLLILACLMCAFSQVQAYADSNVAAVRFAHFEVLSQQYAAAVNTDISTSAIDAGKSAKVRHKSLRFHEFAPKFLALAEENPTDEAALRCCEWIIVYGAPCSSDREMYEADCTAWEMIRNHQTANDHMRLLCLKAAQYPTREREQFLRTLPEDYRQPVEVHGMAFLALADLLAMKCDYATEREIVPEKSAPEWRDYIASGDVEQMTAESGELYRHVLDHFADLPFPLGVSQMGESLTLGDVATERLRALESPALARKALPNRTATTAREFDYLSGN